MATLADYTRAIEESGFLLESRVARALREMGCSTTPNSPILHPREHNEVIEIDIEASIEGYQHHDLFRGTWSSLLIECKSNHQPIAFFSHPEEKPEINAYCAACCSNTWNGSDLVAEMDVTQWHHYGRAATVATQLCSFQNKSGKIVADPCSLTANASIGSVSRLLQ